MSQTNPIQQTKTSYIPVYKDNIAQQLLEEKFQLELIRPNGKYPGHVVYYFKQVPGLQKRIDQLVEQIKQIKQIQRGISNDNYK